MQYKKIPNNKDGKDDDYLDLDLIIDMLMTDYKTQRSQNQRELKK